jgi:hypothetical protein
VNILRSVSVSIWPLTQSGTNEATLAYAVTIANTGNVSDTYNLENTDTAGWTTMSLSSTSVGPLPPFGSSDNTTTLSVTIPSNATGGTIDNITVTATSQGNGSVMTSASCTAVVTIVLTGTASIRMAGTGSTSAPFLWGIRKAKTTENLVVNTGDNLRLRFLAQDNVTVENDIVIWSRTAPGEQVVSLMDLTVAHDNNLAGGNPAVNMKRVKLILTDSSGNVILDNMAWYRVVQDDWSNRISWIILRWSGHNSSQQNQLSNEITQIIIGWGSAPTARDQHDYSR